MNFLRPLLLTLLAAILAGCVSNDWSPRAKYSRVRVTDPRGELVADWIAVGQVSRTETGYRFRAVERFTNGPHPQRAYYPNGRRVDVSGPNILVAPSGKPYWLHTLQEGEVGVYREGK